MGYLGYVPFIRGWKLGVSVVLAAGTGFLLFGYDQRVMSGELQYGLILAVGGEREEGRHSLLSASPADAEVRGQRKRTRDAHC